MKIYSATWKIAHKTNISSACPYQDFDVLQHVAKLGSLLCRRHWNHQIKNEQIAIRRSDDQNLEPLKAGNVRRRAYASLRD